MPRTGDDTFFDPAFVKRPASMGAGLVEREETTLVAEHGEPLALHLDDHALSFWNVATGRDTGLSRSSFDQTKAFSRLARAASSV